MIAMLLVATALAAVQAEARERWNCDDPQYQVEMNACAALDFERADADLNRIWPQLLADARAADGEINPDDQRPREEEMLRRAQRAWIAFRDAHCTREGYEARGGSMEPMLYEGCRAHLTRQRIDQLQPPAAER